MNGLEAMAAAHNNAVLILDELSQVDPREAIACIYMLGNDAGKNRMNADGTPRRTSQWRLSILSSGEVGLGDHAKARTRGGSEVRLLDIDADAGQGLGLFNDTHGAPTGEVFADQLKEASLKYCGTPFREFVCSLCEMGQAPESRLETIQCYRDEFIRLCGLSQAAPEVGRAASRMALLAAAGELATEMGITGWPENEATNQVKRCFDVWLADHGGKQGVHDEKQAVAAVRLYIEQHGSSRFEAIGNGNTDALTAPVRDRVGFRRKAQGGGTEFLFLRETFQSEVCAGINMKTVLKALAKRGLLRRDGKAMTIKARLPGLGFPRVYCVGGAIVGGDDSDTD